MTSTSSTSRRILITDVFGKLSYFVGLQVLFLLWASVVFFIICKVYVPNVGSVHEVHLSFESSGKHGRIFSTNAFSLSDRGSSFFTANQEYKFVVHISVPDSPHNHDVDMSSLRLNLYSLDGNHTATLSNTLLPFYRPWLIDTLDTLFYAPLYLLHLWEKEQTLTTVLSNDYVDNQEFPTCSGRLVLETNGLRWYSATLIISAVLNPITWLLYRYPWIVGVVFVVTVAVALNCLALCEALLRRYGRTSAAEPSPLATVDTQTGLEDVNDIAPIEAIKPADLSTQ